MEGGRRGRRERGRDAGARSTGAIREPREKEQQGQSRGRIHAGLPEPSTLSLTGEEQR